MWNFFFLNFTLEIFIAHTLSPSLALAEIITSLLGIVSANSPLWRSKQFHAPQMNSLENVPKVFDHITTNRFSLSLSLSLSQFIFFFFFFNNLIRECFKTTIHAYAPKKRQWSMCMLLKHLTSLRLRSYFEVWKNTL